MTPTPASMEQARKLLRETKWLPTTMFGENLSVSMYEAAAVIAAALDAARAEEREAIIKLVGPDTGVAAAIRALKP